MKLTPLEKVLNAVGGTQKELAKAIGVTPQSIHLIKKRGGKLPRTKMKEFVGVSGLDVKDLYPDIFPEQ